MIYLKDHLNSSDQWLFCAETHIIPLIETILRETVICLRVLAPNASWGIQKARETVPNLPSAYWRLPLPLQSRWRHKLHHVLGDSVPSVQSVHICSDAFLLEREDCREAEISPWLKLSQGVNMEDSQFKYDAIDM